MKRGLGRKIEQRLQGGAGSCAGAQFQNLPKQHQHHDHGSGLEIDGHLAAGAAEIVGENPRCQRRHRAIGPGRSRAQGD